MSYTPGTFNMGAPETRAAILIPPTKAPAAEGASQNNCSNQGQSTGTSLSAHSAGFSSIGGSPVKGTKKVPCLNPDLFMWLIGPKNWGEAFIDDELTTCLLDNGAQLNVPGTIQPAAKPELSTKPAVPQQLLR